MNKYIFSTLIALMIGCHQLRAQPVTYGTSQGYMAERYMPPSTTGTEPMVTQVPPSTVGAQPVVTAAPPSTIAPVVYQEPAYTTTPVTTRPTSTVGAVVSAPITATGEAVKGVGRGVASFF